MSSTLLLFSILITLLLTTTTLAHPRPAETQPIPDCPIANSRRLNNNPKRAASYTNPALCTIAGPYPQTTYSFMSASTLDGSSLSASGLYSIVLPTATLVGSGGQSIVIGGSTVVLTNTPGASSTMSSGTTASGGNGTQPSLTPTSTTASTSASAAAVTTTTNATGAGARRANTPTSFKSIQRFSGLQISLTLFLGVGVLAGIIYFLDELLDVLV
ncbi:hypothetical protein CF327_g6134 [Tilletia walkeri]|nr:hypothetical protein CF327_g6134 [Tilletia walkeri]